MATVIHTFRPSHVSPLKFYIKKAAVNKPCKKLGAKPARTKCVKSLGAKCVRGRNVPLDLRGANVCGAKRATLMATNFFN